MPPCWQRPGTESIPHRRLALNILRSMRMGNPLLRDGDSAFSTWVDGVPNAVHLFDYLVRNRYVAPLSDTGTGAVRYGLTDAGRELHDRGEKWWRSLAWWERLTVALLG